MTEIYSHPTIHEKTHDELLFRLDQIRNRRLVAAIEYRTAAEKRMEKENAKLTDQWEKLRDRLQAKIIKLDMDINDIEKGIQKMTEISHKIKLTEFSL